MPVYLALDPLDAWEGKLAPWLEARTSEAPTAEGMARVLVPDQATGAWLRNKAAEDALPLFGIEFVTPGRLRNLLREAQEDLPATATREDMALLLQARAERAALHCRAGAAFARNASELLRARDTLAAASYPPSFLRDKDLAAILDDTESGLKKAGLQAVQELDAALREQVGKGALGGPLLLWGFTAMHWPLANLLHAAVSSSTETAAVLLAAGDSSAERAWIGHWEEKLGEAEVLPEYRSAPAPFRDFADRLPEGTYQAGDEAASPVFLVGRDGRGEARRMVTLAQRWLKDPLCTRLGLVLPRNSLTAREVGALLHQAELPFADSHGYFASPPERQEQLNRWARWQEDPRLDAFCELLERVSNDAPQARKDFQAAFQEVQTDECPVVFAWLKANLPESHGHAAADRWVLLPNEGLLLDLLNCALPSLRLMGWTTGLDELVEKAERLQAALPGSLSRQVFLTWLTDSLRVPGRARYVTGQGTFVRLFLVDYAQALHMDFSHVMLGGLEEGGWPPEGQGIAVLPDEVLEEANQQALRQGSQGEGHLTVTKNLVLTPAITARLAEDGFARLVGATGQALMFSSAHEPAGTTAECSRAGDLFLKAFRAAYGTMPREGDFEELIRRSGYLLHDATRASDEEVDKTLDAWRRRRAMDQPLGAWDCGFANPPEKPLVLSAKNWAAVLSRPASIWLENVLRVKPREAFFREQDSLVRGSRLHAWLQIPASGDWVPRPSQGEWTAQVSREAHGMRTRAELAYQAVQRELPLPWIALWRSTFSAARSIAEAMEDLSDWPLVASENDLPPGCEIVVGERRLPLTGRIDCLFAQSGEPDTPLWIVDFKTGNDKPLKVNDLLKGKGLQVALYALARRSASQHSVGVSILQPGEVPEIQLHGDDLNELDDLISGLAEMSQRGILGMAGARVSEYGFSGNYPIALMPVDDSIYEARWALTYPNLPFPGSNS